MTWGAASTTPSVTLKLADGTTLDPVGSLVRLGYFSFPGVTTAAARDTLISADASDPSTLNSFFTEYSSTFVGRFGSKSFNQPGRWQDAPSNAPSLLFGQQMFYWTFNSSTLAAATKTGVFYADDGTNTAWAFPTDPGAGAPGATSTDLAQVTNVVYGSGSVGGGSFNMGTAIPEPSTYISFILGLLITVA